MNKILFSILSIFLILAPSVSQAQFIYPGGGTGGSGSGDITDVGDVASGAAFDGTAGSLLKGIASASGSAAGDLTLSGGLNSSTGAGGNVLVKAGTSTTGSQGIYQAVDAWKGTATVNQAVCSTSTSSTVANCAAGAAANLVGIALTNTTPVQVVTRGSALVVTDGAVAVQDKICLSTTVAGQGHGQGTIPCSPGTRIGVVKSITENGASNTLPLVALAPLGLSIGQAFANITVVTRTSSSGTYNVTSTDSYIELDCATGGGNIVVNLPAATGTGREITFKKIDSSSTYTVVLTRAGSDTIDGATTVTMSKQWGAVKAVDTKAAVWERSHINEMAGDVTGISSNNTVTKIQGKTVTITSQATGDILYGSSATVWANLAKGAQYTFLQAGATIPGWSDYTMPASVAQYDVLYGSATNAVGVITKVNNAILGWNATGVLGAYTSFSFDDSAAQFYNVAAPTKLIRLDASGLTAGETAVIKPVGNYTHTQTTTATTNSTFPAGTNTLGAIQTATIDGSAHTHLTTAQMQMPNCIVTNLGQTTADINIGLPAATVGLSCLFTVATARSNHWGVLAAAGDAIYIVAAAGTISAKGTDADAAVMVAAQLGQSFGCWTQATEAGPGYDWFCRAIAVGTSTFEAHAAW